MRIPTLFLAASLLLATAAPAQETDKFEVGTSAGVTLALNGDSEFFVGIPGTGSVLLAPTIYTTIFASPSIMIEPQVLFWYSGASEDAIFSGFLQAGYLFTPLKPGSLYAAATGGWVTLAGEVKSAIVGGGGGYRFHVGKGAAVRLEARYRRWLCDGCSLNEITLAIGAGAVF
jgi:hypothetical protein